jgi:hypothetical protein
MSDDSHDRDVELAKEGEEEEAEDIDETEQVREEERERITGEEDLERRKEAADQENVDNHRDEEPFES